MTDTEPHPGVRQSWKSLRNPKPVSNSPRNWRESAKAASIYDQHENAPQGSSVVEIARDPKTVSNCARNGPESAKTTSVDDRHVNAPRGSSIVGITPGPQKSE